MYLKLVYVEKASDNLIACFTIAIVCEYERQTDGRTYGLIAIARR